VPARPVSDLVAVAPVLVIEANANVMPLTHEISPNLGLGSLADHRLTTLADDWLGAGRGDALASICARTWAELTAAPAMPAVYWYDEVAAQTWPAVVQLRPAM
jgi:hypothetical protein